MKRQINVAPLTPDIEDFKILINKLDGVINEFDIDIVDWKRTKNKTLTIFDIADFLPQKSKVNFDVQMDDPTETIYKIIDENLANRIIINYECDKPILPFILEIKSKGISVGIGINPENSIEEIAVYFDYVNYLQIMTIDPGVQGNPMNFDRLNFANDLINAGFKGEIAIDGGVNLDTIKKVKNYPINVCSVGSFICKAENPVKAYKQLSTAFK